MYYKKIRDFLTRTGLGLFLAWGCAAAIFLAVISVAPSLGKAQIVAAIAALVVLAVASLWYVMAFTVALVKRQWRKAALMFVLGGAGTCLLAVGFGLAMAFNFWVGAATWKQKDEKPRMVGVPGEDGKTAFSVEYINAHPFLAEYDKTIVFKSGKRVGVRMDTGGAGPFAVYRLGADEYYLVDGLKHNFIRNDYRVNTAKETVEMMIGDAFWIRIPDDALAVVGGGDNSISVKTVDEECKNVDGELAAVGDSLACRRYLGLVTPRGKFEASPDGKDPHTDVIEPQWAAVDARAANLPFALEWRCARNGFWWHGRTTTTAGKHFGLYHTGKFNTCRISVGAPGVYRVHIMSKNGRVSDWFDNEYRIDVNREKVEMFFDKCLLNIPPGTVDILSFGMRGDRAYLTTACEDGTKIESSESIPADKDKYQYVLVGTIDSTGCFHPLSPESADGDAQRSTP